MFKQEYLHWRLIVLYLSCSVGTPWNECCFVGRVTRLDDFSPNGLFWKLIVMFCNVEVAQRNGNILGYFLVWQIIYIFTHISCFKTWFVVQVFQGFKSNLMLVLWTPKLSLDVDIFGLATVQATFKNIGQFFSTLLVALFVGQMKQNVTEVHKIICSTQISTLLFMAFASVITITITILVQALGHKKLRALLFYGRRRVNWLLQNIILCLWFEVNFRIHQLPVSAARWQHWSYLCFCNFYFVKNHKIVNISTITEAREKVSKDLESL